MLGNKTLLATNAGLGNGTELKIGSRNHSNGPPSLSTSSGLHAVTKNGNTHRYWFNAGSLYATVTFTFAAEMERAFVRYHTSGTPGRNYELIVFDTELSLSDLNIIKNYYNTKYSKSLSDFSI